MIDIRITQDKNELGRQAAALGAEAIRAAIARHGEATIIVATGASQFEMLQNLVVAKGIDWSKVTAFHLDKSYWADPVAAKPAPRVAPPRAGQPLIQPVAAASTPMSAAAAAAAAAPILASLAQAQAPQTPQPPQAEQAALVAAAPTAPDNDAMKDLERLFRIRDQELGIKADGGMAPVGYEATRPSPL